MILETLFTRPQFLWLLCLIPLLAVGMRRSLAPLSAVRQQIALWIRVLLLVLLCLAIAGLRVPWKSFAISAVYAVDRSASISPEAERSGWEFLTNSLATQQPSDTATVFGFAENITPLTRPKEANAPWLPAPAEKERSATNLAQALGFSLGVFQEGAVKRLVLLTDGNDTGGQIQEAAQTLKKAGVELLTVPLKNPPRPEVLVERLEMPQSVREAEPFDATAYVRSNVATPCTARLYANGFRVAEITADLAGGPNPTPLVFRKLRPERKTATYRVEITAKEDTLEANNQAQATVAQQGEPSVLLIDPAPEKLAPLAKALKQAGISAETRPPNGLPSSLEELQTYDALILSDVSALQMSREQMSLYTRWVKDFGGGFALLGGDNSFGLGGYFRTPIEAMLPLRMDHDDAIESPTVAVMIILDSSGSMTAQVAGQTKMSLANQGAALALDVLQPKDLLGVMAVDTRVHQIAPLSKHENRADVAAQILRVTAGGGGIYIYTSLVEAYAQLREANAKIKHVILFSDAADAEEKSAGQINEEGKTTVAGALDLAAAMVSAQITTSVVGLGTADDKDTAFLKQLAATGAGRFYLTNDALSLPQIFTTETMRVAQSSLRETPFLVQQIRPAKVLAGIDWAQSPPLGGYNLTKPKETADLLLATETGDPLLSTWRYGAGRVAAFTSDAKTRWAGEWLSWPGYGKFWSQLTRSLLRPKTGNNGAGVELTTEQLGEKLKVTVEATEPNGAFKNGLGPLTLQALQPDGTNASMQASQIAPGRYQGEIKVSGTGTTWLTLQSSGLSEAGTLFGFTAPYPAEFRQAQTNETALKELTTAAGGSLEPTPQTVFARPQNGVMRFFDLAPLLLTLAICLLPIDVWNRRRP